MQGYSEAVESQAMVMGILNVTPDSFSDCARLLAPEEAVARGRKMFDEGAAVVDVGGESTRPGAEPVPVDEELARVVDVVAGLAPYGQISIDTTKPEVAQAAVAAGAEILNDVSASLHEVAAQLNVTWIAVHRQGTPATMQIAPYYADIVADVGGFLAEAIERGRAAGVPEVWVDPGIGFGKTTDHNLELLANLRHFTSLGAPVVFGASRKRFIGELHAVSDARDRESDLREVPTDDRLEGSLAAAAWAFAQGVSVVRVHDVAATVDAMKVAA